MNQKSIFPRVESKLNGGGTILLQTLFFGLLFSFFVLMVLGPLYGIYKRGFDEMLYPALICWGISIPILIPVTRYYFINKRKIASKIIVDQSGLLFYNAYDEIVEKILYSELSSSTQIFDIYTVKPLNSGVVPLLEININPEKEDKKIKRIDMNLPLYVVKNKYTLYAHFLHGITIFRPDLKIDPAVLLSYSIDPDTWKVNSKGVSFMAWILILLALIIAGVIVGLVFLLTKTEN
ncbi:hypothetical protein [Chryseobacterium sp. G0186]|uniref:hypothetical protein n=1 Tax=Chryseobacterium sp. G0186 TaxID=2487064 RepID=UPI000F516DCE|nr:hypothetical protein [Chryseobacterium sp. G0186]